MIFDEMTQESFFVPERESCATTLDIHDDGINKEWDTGEVRGTCRKHGEN